jgi:hypothetical protein
MRTKVSIWTARALALAASSVVSGCGSKTPTSPTAASVTISPSSFSIKGGESKALTVTVASGRTVASCSATAGVLVVSGTSLTYTSPVASVRVEITCKDSAGIDNSASPAIALVSATLTLDYQSDLPAYASAPAASLPVLRLGEPFGAGSNFVTTVGCTAQWLGPLNHWQFTCPDAAPGTTLYLLMDPARATAEAAALSEYCTGVKYNGNSGSVHQNTPTGCVGRFR